MRVADHYTFTLALLVGLLSVTRVVRLIVDDEFPPMIWLRDRYVMKLVKHFGDEGEGARRAHRWARLVECPWCISPYVAVPAVAWFALLIAFPSWTALVWTWWIVNSIAAVSWLSSWLTVRDLPPDQRE